jgi:hypothetical protein
MVTATDDKPDVEAFENEEKKDVFDLVAEEDISLEQRQMELHVM